MTELGWKKIWGDCSEMGHWEFKTPFNEVYEVIHYDTSVLPYWRFGERGENNECKTVAECMEAVEQDYGFRLREGMKLLAKLQKKSLDNL